MNINFEQYDEEHPDIYPLILHFARELLNAGFDKYSMRSIFHRIRWHMNVEKRHGDEFRINNNYSQDYSMKIMDEYPEFEGFFELRF